jgi:ABC-2 type transport system permease protein
MRRLATMFRMLLLMELRHPSVLFWNFAFPVGLLLLNSLIFAGQGPEPVAAVAWLTAGIVVLNIMSGAFLGDASRLVHVREQGILQRVQASPLPPTVLILAYTSVRLLLVLLQSALITAVAVVALGARFAPAAVLLAGAVALAGTLAFVLLGQAIAALAPGAGAASAVGNVIYFPLMFISNLFLPAEMLPGWLVEVARFTPAFMLVDLVRPTLTGAGAVQAAALNLAGLALFGLLGLLIAARWFRWEPWR